MNKILPVSPGGLLRNLWMLTIATTALSSLLGCGAGQSNQTSGAGTPGSTPPTSAPLLAAAVVGSSPGVAIPPDFLGLSHEWGVAENLAGTNLTGKNLQYRRLLLNLLQYTTHPMVLRVGGNSTDTTTAYRASDLNGLNDLSTDLNGQIAFILGINMGANDPLVATTEIQSIAAAIPPASLLGLELGNEPDSYAAKGLRSADYSFADYLSQLTVWNGLVASSSTLPPVSPALAGFSWISDYEQVLPTVNAPPQVVTQHFYAGQYLASQPEPADFLLADENATSGPQKLAPYVAAAHLAGRKLRIGELNSLSNGGQPGVSDTFSAALWGVDIMFEFANAQADGVNWHTGNGGPYGLFQFSSESNAATGLNSYALTQVSPLYYGLQFFEQATTANSSLLPVTLQTQANVKVWATNGTDGQARIVILNKDEAASGAVTLAIPGFNHAVVSRLLAPSLSSTTQVTLGGQTYDGSTDGTMLGLPVTQSIEASGGSFTFTMPVVSAALVTLTK